MPKPLDPPVDRYDSFPLISQFSRQDMDRAAELMETDVAYQEQEKALAEERAAIKAELAEIAERNDIARVGGFRYGQIAFYYKPGTTRRTLKPELLVERAYCTAEQIEECKVEGKAYTDMRIVDLSKSRKTA